MGMKVLVTGGSGFIGSRLVKCLLERGHEVRIFDKTQSSKYPELCFVGDVRDSKAVHAAIKGIDVVYHLAAEHRDDVRPISLYYEVNVEGTRVVAEACAASGVLRVIFTSSVAVYGLNAGIPSEDQQPKPFNDYGRSKLQGEDVLSNWLIQDTQRQLTIVRPTVVFGEGNRGNVFNLVKQIVSGRFVMVGSGANCKSMAYVENVVSFLAFVGVNQSTHCATYNYVDKPDLSMNELVGLVRNFMGKSPYSQIKIPYWLGMAGGACFDILSQISGKSFPVSKVRVKKFCADTSISVARLETTGFIPPFALNKGMEMFLNYEFGSNGGKELI